MADVDLTGDVFAFENFTALYDIVAPRRHLPLASLLMQIHANAGRLFTPAHRDTVLLLCFLCDFVQIWTANVG